MHEDAKTVLTLFVMGNSARSVRAIVNVRRLCERLLPGAYRLDVVDIATDPAQARSNQMLAVPTLVLSDGEQARRFVGDMSNDDRIVEALHALGTGRIAHG
ncbi:MAG: circadian clock KaiB family protein [Burkholderiaceae bacterium]